MAPARTAEPVEPTESPEPLEPTEPNGLPQGVVALDLAGRLATASSLTRQVDTTLPSLAAPG